MVTKYETYYCSEYAVLLCLIIWPTFSRIYFQRLDGWHFLQQLDSKKGPTCLFSLLFPQTGPLQKRWTPSSMLTGIVVPSHFWRALAWGKDVFAWDLFNLKSISHFQEMDLALITELKMWKQNIFFEGCISEAGLGGTISLQRKTLSIQLDHWMDFRSPVNSDEAFLSPFH